MKASKCWGGFQDALLCCLCCFRTKRRSMENLFVVSGTKWNVRSREPVMLHDILSNDITEFRDNKSLEVTAMMHNVKDDSRELLNSTSELCLEDDADLGDLGLRVCSEGREGYGALPNDETEGGGTVEKPVDEGCESKAFEETKGKSGPSGEARGGERRDGASQQDQSLH